MGFGIALAMVFPAKISSSTIDYNHAVIYAPPKIEVAAQALDVELVDLRKFSKVLEVIQDEKKYLNENGQCSCVTAVKAWTGYDKTVGAAKNWPAPLSVPEIGAVIVTREGKVGHVGVVEQIWMETVVIKEFNYYGCQTTRRELQKDDPLIIGYFKN